jgi:amino acid transporter
MGHAFCLTRLVMCFFFSLSSLRPDVRSKALTSLFCLLASISLRITWEIVIIYILINLALIVFYRRDYPAEFSILRHGILPVIASVIMLLSIYGLLWPVPAYPNNLVPYIMLVWIVLGGIYLYLIASRRPDLLEAMGRVMVEEQPPRGEQEPATDTA